MGRDQPSRAQYSAGLTYVAQKPAFLQTFGRAMGAERDGGGEGSGSGRAALPEGHEGRWDGEDEEEEDEWEMNFGGSDEGPQVVVLKEGRHLSADEVARVRRRAKGLPTPSPPPESKDAAKDARPKSATGGGVSASSKKINARPTPAGAKRKLVDDSDGKDAKTGKEGKKKKKGKAAKGLLSFDEADGE